MPNILIFGDTHLAKFDPKKYIFLQRIISQAEQVVINGDFWDSWFTTFDQFVNSQWQQLFPLLLARNTIYIYGNHDPKELCDERVKLFSTYTTDNYHFQLDNQTFEIFHGHNIQAKHKPQYLRMYSSFVYRYQNGITGKALHYSLHFLEFSGYKLLGKNLMTKNIATKLNNQAQKKLASKSCWQICSDTHSAEIDHENLYANTGGIIYNHASYLTLDPKGIHLHYERY